jgi:hypothetical protein
MKLKLKGCWFDIIEEIQAESQRVLDTLTKKDFEEVLQKWRNGDTGVDIQERTTSRVMWPIGLMVGFMIFTVSVQNILDTTMCLCH